jgi:hypothetical protein
VQALRAMFASVGQLLLVADRAKNSRSEQDRRQPRPARQDREKRSQRSRRSRAETTPAASRWRSLDETGNVRLLSAEDLAEIDAEHAAAAAAEPRPASGQPVAPAHQAPPLQAPAHRLTADSLPVPNYDELAIASLRARLRHLDAAQLRTLLDYEQANAARTAVLTMFERRIAKLANGQD